MVLDQILLGVLIVVSLVVIFLLYRLVTSENFKSGKEDVPPPPKKLEPETSIPVPDEPEKEADEPI
jgi:hypothetical protein